MTNTLPLIGVSGLRSSGKNSVVDIMCKHVPFTHQAYGNEVRNQVATLLLLHNTFPEGTKIQEIIQFLEEHKEDKIHTTHGWVRQLLQSWAMMRRALCGSDYWLQFVDHSAGTAISDVRFTDEIGLIHSLGGTIWRVERPGVVSDGHPSEPTELEADLLIENEGTLEDLEKVVLATLSIFYGLQPEGV